MRYHTRITAAPAIVTGALVAFAALAAASCSTGREDAKKRITPEYDKTGRLQLLKYDSKGNGTVDTWSYMDGARVVRIEIDTDGDGRIDRWEYYGPDQKLEKLGVSTHRNGAIDRVQYYEHAVMVRAEEDTDADGRMDKWETYGGARLTSVAFDTTHRGVPDRRLTYGPGGTANVEVDLEGDGHLLPKAAASSSQLLTPATSAFRKE